MAENNVPQGSAGRNSAEPAGLTREQVSRMADEIACSLRTIGSLAVMAVTSCDMEERTALNLSIESVAMRAGYMADLINTRHGGCAVIGGANQWLMPHSLSDLQS